jgi:cysteinyl-tRNA synthetase
MSYIIFDVIRRYLKYRGYRVRHIQNVTDIDDKIIDRANARGIPAQELAEGFTRRFFEDMDALNIERVEEYPRATGEIDKIIEVIGGLIDKGHAYPAGGSVYFRVKNCPDYGKLSHRSLETMMSGGCAIEREKEHPMDFALWKAVKPGEPSWPSPWGEGRPGWHIECSAMSLKYLGETIDIHGGGQDLIFPHHENEIAQSECFTGRRPFVKYWLHNGMLVFGDEKMSKSLGNLVTIRQALADYGVDGLRIFVLGSHYRSPLTYSVETIAAAVRGAERLREAVAGRNGGGAAAEIDLEAPRAQFIAAMDDDFNTARALAVMFDLARDINRAADGGADVTAAQALLRELGGIIGLTFAEREQAALDAAPFRDLQAEISAAASGLELAAPAGDEAAAYIDWLVAARTALRKQKQFQTADEIRNRLDGLGVVLEDGPSGTVWKRK